MASLNAASRCPSDEQSDGHRRRTAVALGRFSRSRNQWTASVFRRYDFARRMTCVMPLSGLQGHVRFRPERRKQGVSRPPSGIRKKPVGPLGRSRKRTAPSASLSRRSRRRETPSRAAATWTMPAPGHSRWCSFYCRPLLGLTSPRKPHPMRTGDQTARRGSEPQSCLAPSNSGGRT
jgi:hypothetical protein